MKDPEKLTPSMRMYVDLKSKYPDGIMMYQIGDFYEMFFEDAIRAVGVLGLALTKKKQSGYEDIDMCGVPMHSASLYIKRLVDKGFCVVLCDQKESPEEAKSKRGSGAIIRREAVRVITPGTITEDNLLDSDSNNFLACFSGTKKGYAFAWVDISTGDFFYKESSIEDFQNCIFSVHPKQIIISDKIFDYDEMEKLLKSQNICTTVYPESFFDYGRALSSILKFYEITTVKGLGDLRQIDISACGALTEYISLTQISSKPILLKPKKYDKADFLLIDSSAIKNLELFKQNSGEKSGSLFYRINYTSTSCGSRMLQSLMRAPMCDQNKINARLDAIELFIGNMDFCNKIRTLLSAIPDFERSISRVSLRRAVPQDLHSIAVTIKSIYGLAQLLLSFGEDLILSCIYKKLGQFEDLANTIEKAVVYMFSGTMKEGGFIKQGYSSTLDNILGIKDNLSSVIAELLRFYRDTTGIPSLKIAKNNIIGFYLEVPSGFALNKDAFQHKQTTTSCIRYTTLKLKELENKILSAEQDARNIEIQIFDDLCRKILSFGETFKRTANAVAELDIITSFAFLAFEKNYTRPLLSQGKDFDIKLGKHPLLEEKHNFKANDLLLNQDKFISLVTGPNMAGKSTFLRQNAIIAILAHMGSYVPAQYAKIGIMDQIFSRVGTSDDISMGYSTFMTEMIEVSSIINRATDKSFVIVDEIGRGTAVYDGFSIALAVIEYVHNKNMCRSIFSTHYHEIAERLKSMKHIKCLCVKVEEWNDEIVFLHSVIEGISKKSYGINIAKMSGMPKELIERSKEIMRTLSNEGV